MSKLEMILSRLSGVRNAPNDNYQANCPCPYHSKTNNGKLYLKDMGDKVVMDCKSGCTAMEVLYELELQLKDLYPDSSPAEKEAWREKEVIRAVARDKDKAALNLWVEVCVMKELLQHRIFSNLDHPKNKADLLDREAQAYRMLPKFFKEYYKCN